ncbi:helix-hairpin-helix domain-containing protein [Mucilaginibacter sp.]
MPGSIKTQIKNYLSLSKKEWNGMMVLLWLIAAALIAPEVYTRLHTQPAINTRQLSAALARLSQVKAENGGIPGASPSSPSRFNPNHLNSARWAQLGLNAHQISTIQHYESKGGKFRSKQDVKKMYSLTANDYARLAPYIDLPDSVSNRKNAPAAIVDLNTADSAKLTQVNGIGPAYAMRILHYRERLGGFHHKEQLKEVFGIDEGMYNTLKAQFTLRNRRVKKININTVELDGLKNHPYLNFKQANAIIQYRKQHGNYESLAELKNIAILDEQILRKLAPYLTLK